MIGSAIMARLAALRLSRKAMAEVLSIVSEIEAAAELMAKREAERKARDRARKTLWKIHGKAGGNSVEKSVENPVASPPKERSPTPPKEITPSASLRSDNNPKGKDARASRIPEAFEPDLAEAIRLGLSPADAEREAANFVDYWHQANGRTAVKRDWPAAFRVWCRKAVQDRGNARPAPRTNGLDALISAAADLDQDLARQPRIEHGQGQLKLVGK